MKEDKVGNIKCFIGSNAADNWEILDKSKPYNIFFHLSSFPSCFVILKTDDYPLDTEIKEAALLCKNNTKYKNLKDIKVDYTFCKNVEKGTVIGEVTYKSNKKVKQVKV
jgi:predicted ribosome quality control (RQC) complex YloA/Tae2 family protein